jgi:nucleotide-binding universal stress UspA family protein
MMLDKVNQILVPTDFSESSDLALRGAIQLARKFGAAVEVLHVDTEATVMVPPPGDLIAVPIDVAELMQKSVERLNEIAENVRRTGLVCTTATEVGTTHTEIVDHAQRIGADLIVMGTHGRHGLGHALVGSIAEKVVQHALCPVLVIPLRVVEQVRVPDPGVERELGMGAMPAALPT